MKRVPLEVVVVDVVVSISRKKEIGSKQNRGSFSDVISCSGLASDSGN